MTLGKLILAVLLSGCVIAAQDPPAPVKKSVKSKPKKTRSATSLAKRTPPKPETVADAPVAPPEPPPAPAPEPMVAPAYTPPPPPPQPSLAQPSPPTPSAVPLARNESSLARPVRPASSLAPASAPPPALAQPVPPQASLSQPRALEPSGAQSAPAQPALALPPPPALAAPTVQAPPVERPRPKRDVVVGQDTLVVASESAASTSRMAPYAVKVVISTSALKPAARLTITCDEPVVTGSITPEAGTQVGGMADKTRYRIQFDQSGFKPDHPLTVLLMAAHPIQVISVD